MGRIATMLGRIESAMKDFDAISSGIQDAIKAKRKAVSERDQVLGRALDLADAIENAKNKKLPPKEATLKDLSVNLGKLKKLNTDVGTCDFALKQECKKARDILHRFESNEIETLLEEKRKNETDTKKSKRLGELYKAYGQLDRQFRKVGDSYRALEYMTDAQQPNLPDLPLQVLNSPPKKLAEIFLPDDINPYDY